MSITVIGAGAWGTAFAFHLARKGRQVLLWTFEKELSAIIAEKRENTLYLPGFALPKEIQSTPSLDKAVEFSRDIVLATPSFALRKTIQSVAPKLKTKRLLILTKGIERETLLRMSEVIEEVVGEGSSENVAALSGPSFAKEVAEGSFTASVIASRNKELARYFQKSIHSESFRVYLSDDIIGVELGGALKNIMAIGAGIIQGMSLGTNTLAAFVTRALAEMKRFGKALGAEEATFVGLSGIGDLILTSYGNLSRNRLFGSDLAGGQKAKQLIEGQSKVVEGYYTINAVYSLSRKLGVVMPITEELFRILYEGKDIQLSLHDIITREFKEEND